MQKNEIISATCLLLAIAQSDDNIDENELTSIKEIIKDFFNIKNNEINAIMDDSKKILNDSTDIFEFGKELNNTFSYQDKIDFICCTFEVAFSDGNLHYIEEYDIKKIANILNVNHADLIRVKSEMKKYL